MAISEVTVRDAIKLAVDEINAAGGVLGKQIQIVGEDGASEPTVFAEKAEKLISSDCVAAVFGGWTSSSRKAMLPVFESNNSLLYYPVQYEGLESSQEHLLHRRHHQPADRPGAGLPEGEGRQVAVPGGQRLRVPADRQPHHQGVRRGQRHRDQGRGLHPAGLHRLLHHRQQGRAPPTPDAVFNTLNGDSNVAFFKEYTNAGLTPQTMPVVSVSIAEEEVERHRRAEHRRAS